jgi:hypothetical protein
MPKENQIDDIVIADSEKSEPREFIPEESFETEFLLNSDNIENFIKETGFELEKGVPKGDKIIFTAKREDGTVMEIAITKGENYQFSEKAGPETKEKDSDSRAKIKHALDAEKNNDGTDIQSKIHDLLLEHPELKETANKYKHFSPDRFMEELQAQVQINNIHPANQDFIDRYKGNYPTVILKYFNKTIKDMLYRPQN